MPVSASWARLSCCRRADRRSLTTDVGSHQFAPPPPGAADDLPDRVARAVGEDRLLAGPEGGLPHGARRDPDNGPDRGRRPPGRYLRSNRHRPPRDDDRPRPSRRGGRPAGARSRSPNPDRKRARPDPQARRCGRQDAAGAARLGAAVHHHRPGHRAVRRRAHPAGAARQAHRVRRARGRAGARLPADWRRPRIRPLRRICSGS